MTVFIHQGYILHAAAKSVVGIGFPDEKGDNRRARVFFIVVYIATLALWWVGGGAPARRSISPVTPTPYVSPPNPIDVSGSDNLI
ncbi:hypothetical protein H8U82_000948 [Escherichia coli]|uniref:hypothetical protein n=1 Tax=Escherichia coli TaxID=562 RepID=UPI000AE059D2|nr:hypothetical protein [Escherichia coli]EEC7288908.1 hypothetical protein [Escherichia coli]EER3648077.1 hypothetical protein [Escherichia coli]EES0940858.1 hypothetical protein [Escherichia coli]EES2038916.1 hypothetical protein [Escherichia coli]EET2683196.1 hypothetical protein [Escherichia coli]